MHGKGRVWEADVCGKGVYVPPPMSPGDLDASLCKGVTKRDNLEAVTALTLLFSSLLINDQLPTS